MMSPHRFGEFPLNRMPVFELKPRHPGCGRFETTLEQKEDHDAEGNARRTKIQTLRGEVGGRTFSDIYPVSGLVRAESPSLRVHSKAEVTLQRRKSLREVSNLIQMIYKMEYPSHLESLARRVDV